MIWILHELYTLFVNILAEFVVYILIDVWAKNLLRDTRDDTVKRKIWLWESGVVALASLVMYFMHHTPYVLIFLSSTTFLYTQLLGRVNFRYWWRQLATSWDEFQQHEESMEQLAEMLQSQQERTQQAMSSIPRQGWQPPSTIVYQQQQQQQQQQGYGGFDAASVEPWYPSEADNIASGSVGYNRQVHRSTMPPNITPTSQLRPRFDPSTNVAPIYSNANMARHSRLGKYETEAVDLRRKPLHSFLGSPNQKYSNETLTLKNKFLSALGISPPQLQHPGLPNAGRNICFMNCVLQCLGHIPMLAECLSRDCQTLCCTANEADLVIAMANLLSRLSEEPDNSASRVANQDALRVVANKLRPTLMTSPGLGEQQKQQDSAEFLSWLVEALHEALNACRPRPSGSQTQLDNRPKYQNASLEMLKFIYGDLSMQRVDELKLSCQQEISIANGLTSESYAEPLQRLSDLEWLSYKAANNSVLDDLFTGQLVESQRCTQCNKISVQIQTFNILPVPIVEPRQLNGLVYLEDCFAKFGRIEDLRGRDGLRCDSCNNRVGLSSGATTLSSPVLSNGVTPRGNRPGAILQTVQKRRLLQTNEANMGGPITPGASGMSPISNSTQQQINSSIHDFRTSTPIHSSSIPQTLTDGQKRSLLRQLPDCLIVQLMRFSVNSEGFPIKLQTPVAIPLTQLDLSSLVIDQVLERDSVSTMHSGSHRYDLCGVCVHVGASSVSSGHYMAYARTRYCGWCKFDDETVTQVNMQYELSTKLLRENAYLLFYRKSTVQ